MENNLKWYEYRQNNSGGRFRGPALRVYIQAKGEHVANAIAESHGVYFGGTITGQDCSCCGDRWCTPFDATEEKPEPDYERKSPLYYDWAIDAQVPLAMWVYADGRIEKEDPVDQKRNA